MKTHKYCWTYCWKRHCRCQDEHCIFPVWHWQDIPIKQSINHSRQRWKQITFPKIFPSFPFINNLCHHSCPDIIWKRWNKSINKHYRKIDFLPSYIKKNSKRHNTNNQPWNSRRYHHRPFPAPKQKIYPLSKYLQQISCCWQWWYNWYKKRTHIKINRQAQKHKTLHSHWISIKEHNLQYRIFFRIFYWMFLIHINSFTKYSSFFIPKINKNIPIFYITLFMPL